MNTADAAQRGRCAQELILHRGLHSLHLDVVRGRVFASLHVQSAASRPVAQIEIMECTPIGADEIGDDAFALALLSDDERDCVIAWLRGYWSTRA